jgi:2-succinyl-5-enolpyruvyl-6-hydroxy-3-cyclohexene-1-carboxylate synthase
VDAPARAVHLLQSLLGAGVRDVVLTPGSRSAPLALALYAADAAGDLRLHVRIDERTAGFLALGLTIGSRRPVAVVTTSGTAVGNLLPAVMEAAHSGRRLVVVSADRPAELRGTGANQTTWQDGIFAAFAPTTDLAVDAAPDLIEAAAAQARTRAGPTHLNVQLDTPLLPHAAPWWPGAGEAAAVVASGLANRTASLSMPRHLVAGPRTVVVAGDDAGPAARALAEGAGVPLLAEPTSGSRAGTHAVRSYRLLLGTGLGRDIERVVVVGHPTLSRPVTGLLSRGDVQVLSVRTRSGVATDPGRCADVLETVPTPEGVGDPAWLARWQEADRLVSARLDSLVDALPELDALQVAAEVGAALTPGASLVVGASNPVRDLDLMLRPYPPRQRRLVVGNRGLAGIDGTVSTAVGVDLGRDGAPRTMALLGDLTFLHDAGGLVIGPAETRPDLTLVVVNDNGGSIFSLLEQGAAQYAAGFERVFATAHGVDLGALARASGAAYCRVGTRTELRGTLAAHAPGLRVLEARVSRASRRATAAAIGELAGDLG